jgi:hypothetical protein
MALEGEFQLALGADARKTKKMGSDHGQSTVKQGSTGMIGRPSL